MALPRPTSQANLLAGVTALVDALEQRLPARTFTTATKPAASSVPVGTIIYVSDGGAGAVFQASNGSAWINLG